MLISCPSCPKVYRVPASAIPPEGRDVTCTACGEVWFERGLEAEVIGVGRRPIKAPVTPAPLAEKDKKSAAQMPVPVAPKIVPAALKIEAANDSAPMTPKADRAAPIAASFTDKSERVRTEQPFTESVRPELKDTDPDLRARLMDAMALLREGVLAVGEWLRDRMPTSRGRTLNSGQRAAQQVRRRSQTQLRNRLTPARLCGWTLWITTVCVSGVVMSDAELVERYWPKAGHAYDVLLDRPAPPLPIDIKDMTSRLALSVEGQVLELRGRVVNRGEGTSLPLLTLEMEGQPLPHRETVAISGTALPMGGERPFVIRAKVPVGATQAAITLAAGEAHESLVPEGFIMQQQGSGWGWNLPPATRKSSGS